MAVPQIDSCRFISAKNIKERIAQDNFQYKSVRVIGKIKLLQNELGYTVIEDEGDEMLVNSYNVRDKI